jgi:hypothetical protein
LVSHPDFSAKAVQSITADAERVGVEVLQLRYLLAGDTSKIVLPAISAPVRRDGLWKTTCFEVFLAMPDGYMEYNFGPSSEWAAYSFAGYRAGVQPVDVIGPEIFLDSASGWFEVEVDLILPERFQSDEPLNIALSAVIEETDGTRSFWALAHPPGQPDFHHPTCFAATLPAPEKP